MSAIEQLTARLEDDTRQLQALRQLLEQEKELLQTNQIEALTGVNVEKSALLGRIRDSARQKIHLLVEVGFRPDQGDPSVFVKSLGLPEVTSAWDSAHDALLACQQVNEVNSRVVTHLQRRIGRLADIMRGRTQQPKLYGSSGRETSLGGSHVLASA